MTNEQHIQKLLEEHKIRRITDDELRLKGQNRPYLVEKFLFEDTNTSSGARTNPWVHLRGSSSWNDYTAALHEIGHIICGHNSEDNKTELQHEEEAWQWAFANARCDITNHGAVEMMCSLLSYYHPPHSTYDPMIDLKKFGILKLLQFVDSEIKNR